ncbi:uncharacterized protein LOC110435880 [Sorghum bicolor]|uniref:uncharacterized protein LOC110435880 n=1 Tax=Sorghum bicolor TaxID=4558 RepID=UPI000B425B97|nr:uncharacterized protein LOC110435880 [Sorghum bicolor]|eukprot:XP_021317643.1 uncharacterized protein LOC110435880 [Sorghum bicolor]
MAQQAAPPLAAAWHGTAWPLRAFLDAAAPATAPGDVRARWPARPRATSPRLNGSPDPCASVTGDQGGGSTKLCGLRGFSTRPHGAAHARHAARRRRPRRARDSARGCEARDDAALCAPTGMASHSSALAPQGRAARGGPAGPHAGARPLAAAAAWNRPGPLAAAADGLGLGFGNPSP